MGEEYVGTLVFDYGTAIPSIDMGQPIVRCGDCRHCMAYAHSAYCDKFAHALPDGTIDGFCKWGEREADDD